jgi:hypothetical protein
MLHVFDLTTGQQKGNYYLGPWLRSIVLDSVNGNAYVSTNGALFKVDYSHLN